MRDQRGTHVAGPKPEALDQASDLRFLSWGGQDLNLRPTDYESATGRFYDLREHAKTACHLGK